MTYCLERSKNELLDLLSKFDTTGEDLREKVLSLIPVWDKLREMGVLLIPKDVAQSARGRILHYFLEYPKTIISHREIMVVSGISEWARRVRELRVEMGWSIISGKTAKEMQASGDLGDENELPNMEDMQADDYIMFDTTQDREAAHRWNIAKSIRNSSGGAKSHIIKFLKENIGKPVTGEELRYVAKDATEWARRTRQLRTEDGWQIQTHWNGRPDLSPGVYVLETDRQLPAHDRIIDDSVRRSVLCRDKHTCQECGWSQDRWNQDNPRHLELHHVKQHIDGGSNEENNLLTLCNICHDRKHKKQTIK